MPRNLPEQVLLITRDFPPYSATPGAMARMVHLADYLRRQNVAVHVLAYERSGQWPLFTIPADVQTHWLRGYCEYHSGPVAGVIPRLNRLVARGVKYALDRFGPRHYIDPSSLYIHRFVRHASEICAAHGIRKVVISTPSHSLQQVGIGLRQRLGEQLTYIADFRDAWTLRTAYQSQSPARMRHREEVETAVLQAANHAIFVSTGMSAAYCEKYAWLSPKAVVIENGYNNVAALAPSAQARAIREAARREGQLTVAYFGSATVGQVNGYKDLLPLFDAVSASPQLRQRTRFVLYGDVRWFRRPEGLSIEVCPGVSAAQARADMACMDIGLVQHSDRQDAPSVMGGKLYEYAAAGLPIWIVAPPNATSLRDFVNKFQKPVFSSVEDPNDIRAALWRFVAAYDNQTLEGYRFRQDEAEACSRDSQYRRFLPLLGVPESMNHA